MRKHHLNHPALALALLFGFTGLAHAQFSIGLYRNGQLVETLTNIAESPVTAPQAAGAPSVLAPSTAAPGQGPVAQSFAGPQVSEETRMRNDIMVQAVQPVREIRDRLRQMQAGQRQNTVEEREQLRMMLRQAISSHVPARTLLVETGKRVKELKLDKTIYARHQKTLAAFDVGLMRFTNAINAVLADKPGGVRKALLTLDAMKVAAEPDLTKATPTRQAMTIKPAPELTREQADALVQAVQASSAAAVPSLNGVETGIATRTINQTLRPMAPAGSRQPTARPAPTMEKATGRGPAPGGSVTRSGRVPLPAPPKLTASATAAPLDSGIPNGPLAAPPPTGADLAPTVDVQMTAEITNKSVALGNSPLAIYEFVRNNCAFQPYLGSRKGSVETLRQRAGNDTDQASLLLALLRAAGIPCRYVRGTVEMTPEQAKSWLGVDNAGTAGNILTTAGLEAVNIMNSGNVVAIRCTRVWVEAYVPYSNYRGIPNDDTGKTWIPMDPAFKETTITPGEDVLTAMGYNNEAFLAGYVSTYNSNSPIEKLEADVQAWLDVNRPGKKVADIQRTIATQNLNLGLLAASLPHNLLTLSSRFAELEDNKRFKVRFRLYSGGTTFIDYTANLTQLAGHRVAIDYVGATPADQATIDSYGGIYQTPPYLVRVKPVLKVDGAAVATSANSIGAGYTHDSDMYFTQPVGDQNVQPVIYNTITAGNGQVIAFDTFTDTPNVLMGDTGSTPDSLLASQLHATAVDYLSRVDRGEEKANALLRSVHTVDVSEVIAESSVAVTYSFGGAPQTFAWTGLIVDADRRIVGPFGVSGDANKKIPYMLLTGYDGSFQENDVFEDMHDQKAVSTIRILQLSGDQGIPTCYITNSIAAACPGFNHSSTVWNAVNTALGQGHVVIIPQREITVSNWTGTGYIDLDPATGAAGYIISGGISGSVTVSGGATVQIWLVFLPCWRPTITADASDPIKSYYSGETTPTDLFCGSDSRHIRLKGHYIVKCPSRPDAPKSFDQTMWLPIDWIASLYGPGEYSFSVASTVLHTFKIYSLEVKKFIFMSDHAQLTDWTGNFAGAGGSRYNPRGWIKGGLFGIGGENNPVTHSKGNRIQADVTVCVKPSGIPFDLTGSGASAAITFHKSGLTSTGSEQAISVTSDDVLPVKVQTLNESITWSVDVNGTSCASEQTGPHKVYALWNTPSGSTATLKRIDWSCNVVAGLGAIDPIEAALHDTLVPYFNLSFNCAANAWTVLDGGAGYDCQSLVTCHMLASMILGLPASVSYAYASTDVDCSSMQTRPCPGGVHGNEKLLIIDASGGLNNYEACCVANGKWYPGGIRGNYSSALAVLRYWLSNGGKQAWTYYDGTDFQYCTAPGPYPVPAP